MVTSAMREVAARDHELRLLGLHERKESVLHRRIPRCAYVEIRDVENADRHGGWRL
jgi:hypothetical protein